MEFSRKKKKRKYVMVKLFWDLECSPFLSPFSSFTLNFKVCVLFLCCLYWKKFSFILFV